MEAELKCRNTASSASGLSFARCWLRAEAVGMEESSPQKSSSSWLIKGNKKERKTNPDGISGRIQE
ncbi:MULTISPECIES: hypothetical protein [unclassified Coprococcus]|uniref:hypothetical protein n=1 Tax=unclassified Coprococcus TaxID=2684943 RepID=UPI0022E6C564|nr:MULTISPECIES: hypothetical protein [unclassified Coprococcus]